MDKINIDNIFNGGKSDGSQYEPIDVYNLYNGSKKNIKHKFNANILASKKDEQKKKIINEYKKIYQLCVNRIKIVNSLNKDNMIYEIKGNIMRSANFDCKECLDYIQKKLKKISFNTCIISKTSILISWKKIN